VDKKPQQPSVEGRFSAFRGKYSPRTGNKLVSETTTRLKIEVEKQLAKFIIDMCDDMDLDPGNVALELINEYDMNPEDLYDTQWLQEHVRDWG
jgi:hypothetical protein